MAQMLTIILDWIENIVGKGENAGYLHFFSFPTTLEFLTLEEHISIFVVIYFVICKCFQFRTV